MNWNGNNQVLLGKCFHIIVVGKDDLRSDVDGLNAEIMCGGTPESVLIAVE